jgi:hypothetical protein
MCSRARRPARIVSALAVALAAGIAPSIAHAQFDLHDPQTGLEGSIHMGYGAFSNNAVFRAPGSSETGGLLGSFGMQFFLGYRFVPVLSAGLHGGFNVLAVRNGGSSDGANAGSFGFYARVHILSFLERRSRTYAGTPDLYVGVGFDPFAQVHAWNPNFEITTSGLAFPFQIGFDYALTENVAVGVLGIAAPWTATGACTRVLSLTGCGSHNGEAEAYLYIGLGVSGHFNLVH